MKSLQTALLVGALAIVPLAQAGADFEVPDDDPVAESGGSQHSKGNRWKIRTKTVVKATACTGGGGMIAFNPPVPLPKMSKRQQQRFEIEVRRHDRAKIEWGVGCGVLGPVGGSAVIAADDFISRFVTREIPPERTKRQEQMLFHFAGGEPMPDLSKPDPDQYGPK